MFVVNRVFISIIPETIIVYPYLPTRQHTLNTQDRKRPNELITRNTRDQECAPAST